MCPLSPSLALLAPDRERALRKEGSSRCCWRHGGGHAGSGKFLGLETFTLPSPFLENELDLEELVGDQRKGKDIVTIDFLIIFVLKQRDVPPN